MITALNGTTLKGFGPLERTPTPADTDLASRFEQMLWCELLTHTGLEKSLTAAGGEDVSAFARYVIEAIARDLSEKHPLGLGERAAGATQTEGV